MTSEANAAAAAPAAGGTPPGRVRGQGSARQGAEHWWHERLSALTTLLLFVWFGVSLLRLPSYDHAMIADWLGSPLAAVPMLLLIASTFWHVRLGLKVIVEDYVHDEGAGMFWLVAIDLFVVLAAAFGLFSVLKLALA